MIVWLTRSFLTLLAPASLSFVAHLFFSLFPFLDPGFPVCSSLLPLVTLRLSLSIAIDLASGSRPKSDNFLASFYSRAFLPFFFFSAGFLKDLPLQSNGLLFWIVIWYESRHFFFPG